MEKNRLKSYMLLISFSIGLVLVVVHFKDILHGVGFFLNLLTPLFVGTILAFALNRPYEAFYKWYCNKCKIGEKKAKVLSVISVYVIAFSALILLASMIIPELGRNILTFAENADDYMLETQTTLNQTTAALGLNPIDLSHLTQMVEQYLGNFSNAVSEVLPRLMQVTSNVLSGIATAFISLTISVYILTGKRHLLTQINRTLRAFFPKWIYNGIKEFYSIVSQVFGDYISGQCKEAIILGCLCFAGMMVLRLDYAALISVIIAITALVPILGAYIGGAIGVILLLFVSPGKALLFLAFLLILQQVEGNLIYPRVVGRKIGLPGMWVMLSITVWGSIFGIWGMLLGVPATTILYQLLKRAVKRKEDNFAAKV